MAAVPRIVVYALADDTPGAPLFIGYHVGPKGAFMGVRFNGSTEAAVREKATTFWIEESARQAKIRGGPRHTPRLTVEEEAAAAGIVIGRVPAAVDFEDLI